MTTWLLLFWNGFSGESGIDGPYFVVACATHQPGALLCATHQPGSLVAVAK